MYRHLVVRVPYLKNEGPNVHITVPGQSYVPALDPIAALQTHFAVNSRSSSRGLFSYRATHPGESGHRELVKESVIKRFNRALLRAGRSPIDSHSFRIGGCSTYLVHGGHPDIIRAGGHWKSDAFLLYWRQQPVIIARSLANILLDEFE
jgi:hypothetical protein